MTMQTFWRIEGCNVLLGTKKKSVFNPGLSVHEVHFSLDSSLWLLCV